MVEVSVVIMVTLSVVIRSGNEPFFMIERHYGADLKIFMNKPEIVGGILFCLFWKEKRLSEWSYPSLHFVTVYICSVVLQVILKRSISIRPNT